MDELTSIAQLPTGWTSATIGELISHDGVFIDGDWVESKDQDPNGDVRLIQLAYVGDGKYRNRSDRFLTSKKAIDLGCTFLKSGDVLIARMPDPLGRACIFPGDAKRSVTVVDVCIVRVGSDGINNKWLVSAINSIKFRAAVASLQSGSTRKRISRGNLATVKLPVPPVSEQDRIVEKIEEIFTKRIRTPTFRSNQSLTALSHKTLDAVFARMLVSDQAFGDPRRALMPLPKSTTYSQDA